MRTLIITVAVLLLTSPALAQQPKAKKAGSRAYPPRLEGARAVTYKTVGDVKLDLYVYEPQGHKPSDKCPAIVFFFGGGWTSGSPGQFEPHCQYLASRGMVAITADYRVASRHGVKATTCVSDAKSAIRYVRQHATELGVDPERIVAAGGSAGGHIAACTALIRAYDESTENTSVSSAPNALALFNPALVLAPVEGLRDLDAAAIDRLTDRVGGDPVSISPYHHIRGGLPPTIIFHGKADTTVRYATADAFAKAMTAAGNDCILIGYEGQPHAFFNYGRGDGEYYRKTVRALDEFLAKLGYLSGPPTLVD